ncbi:ATP-binding protein [Aliikangiella sp. IMCC44359]|uniref:ATP-binding protein n=1 Tax=Aliikangiella sp. IMCC44359 TaxID=3459125 RepID=UPI00403B2B65
MVNISPWLLWGILLICCAPLLFPIDLASYSETSDIQILIQQEVSPTTLQEKILHSLQGEVHHALMEWSAITIALLCLFMAFSRFKINQDIVAPLIGLALAFSGVLDALHVLSATRIIESAAGNQEIMPFTWAVARIFNALVLLLGGVYILYFKQLKITLDMKFSLIAVLAVIGIIYGMYLWISTGVNVPKTQFSDSVINRPYDIFPLIAFCLCLPLFYRIYQSNKNYMIGFLLLGLVANIFSGAYMVFGSKELYDHYFNAAHLLKVLGYLLPFIGYFIDYRTIFLIQETQKLELKKLNFSLSDKQKQLRTINDVLPVGLLQVNSQGVIVSANNYANEIFGYSSGGLLEQSIESLVPTHIEKQHVSLRENFQKKFETRRMAKDADNLVGKRKDGSFIPLEIGLASIVIDNEKQTLVSLIDIAERKQLVQSLQNKNEQMDLVITRLRRSNEQLERFAYVCSHDLQEPIRMVESFSLLLQERLDSKLLDKNEKYLKFVIDGASRAREMVSDILFFCRLEQTVDNKSLVSLSEICQQVKETIGDSLREKKASFKWDEPLPSFTAVRSQLFQLFLNLVSNGIKFNRSLKPEVFVSASKKNGFWEIRVRDNGVGIKPDYHKKIFNIFERLHSKSEFPGTGIGLANCMKIIEQHDAELQVESKEGEGAVFIIKWPDKKI